MNPNSSSAVEIPSFLESSPLEKQQRLLEKARDQWERDGNPDAAAFLKQYGELTWHKSIVVELVYEEYCQKIEAGQTVNAAEFCRRFPDCQRSIERLIEVHDFVAEKVADWPEAGDNFLGFRLVERLGCGSFARVYLARDAALGDRYVAVKVTLAGESEAATLGRLEHPHIVPVYSVRRDEESGLSAICMPFYGRATLWDVIEARFSVPRTSRRGSQILDVIAKLNAADSLTKAGRPDRLLARGQYVDGVALLGAQLADGLARAHAAGTLHLDVKPSNVLLLPNGCPMLLDFNLATDSVTLDNRVGGTLPYMSPEQLLRFQSPTKQGIDGRADLYSLGVLLYQALTGTFPFAPDPALEDQSELVADLMQKQKAGPPKILESDVDSGFEQLLRQCLAFDRDDRPQSAEELSRLLRAQVGLVRRVKRWIRRYRPWVLGAAATLLLAGAAEGVHLATRPPFAEREYSRAVTLYKAQDYAGAIDALDRVILDKPAAAAAYYLRGRARQMHEDFEQAVVDLKKSADLQPTGEAWAAMAYALSRACRNREDWTSVAYFYQKAIAAGNSTPIVQSNLVHAYWCAGAEQLTLREMLTVLDQAIAAEPSLQVAYVNRAHIIIKLTQYPPHFPSYEDAADAFETAADLGPLDKHQYQQAARVCGLAAENGAARYKNLGIKFAEMAVRYGFDTNQLDQLHFSYLYHDARFEGVKKVVPLSVNPPVFRQAIDPVSNEPGPLFPQEV